MRLKAHRDETKPRGENEIERIREQHSNNDKKCREFRRRNGWKQNRAKEHRAK